jgi:starch synthase
MQVLHVAAEAYPLIKTGGLADVASALPQAQRKLDHDTRLLIPGYPEVMQAIQSKLTPASCIELGTAFGVPKIRLWQTVMPETDLPLYVLDTPWFFGRSGNPYVDANGIGWADNHKRFALLGWAAAHIAGSGLVPDWQPSVVHAHDWHAALALAYLQQNPALNTRRIFTIHNLAFQGRFPLGQATDLMLDATQLTPARLEFHGDLSFMKAGIVCAHAVTTVSPTYAQEIQSQRYGEGLDGLLRHHRDKLTGILNGIDTDIWNPVNDQSLVAQYDYKTIDKKSLNKAALRAETGLTDNNNAGPLLAVVSRLSEHKAQDLVAQSIPQLVQNNCQLIVLGSGDKSIESTFRQMQLQYPEHVCFRSGFDEPFAHRIFGGADAILIPSLFEPCGLTQMYGLRYGTVPVVRSVGGLADTVFDADSASASQRPNGFSFTEDDQFVPTIKRVAKLFSQPDAWRTLIENGTNQSVNWDESAVAYLNCYQSD